jgi:hypothetical protein
VLLVADALVIGLGAGATTLPGLPLDLPPVHYPARGPAPGPPVPAPAAVSQAVTAIPAAVYDQVGADAPDPAAVPKAVAPPVPTRTAAGLPQVVYVGAEFCPFTAAERWSLAAALSRFGTLSGLGVTRSSGHDVDPSTASLTFRGASYASPYLSFTGTEHVSNEPDGHGGYQPLDPLTPEEAQLVKQYDVGPYLDADSSCGYPFIDVADRFIVGGSGFDPGALAGQSQAEIAAGLGDASRPATRDIVATANVLSAAFCAVTGQQPAAVCTSPGVVAGTGVLRPAD